MSISAEARCGPKNGKGLPVIQSVPRVRHGNGADDCLAALIHMHMLDPHIASRRASEKPSATAIGRSDT